MELTGFMVGGIARAGGIAGEGASQGRKDRKGWGHCRRRGNHMRGGITGEGASQGKGGIAGEGHIAGAHRKGNQIC